MGTVLEVTLVSDRPEEARRQIARAFERVLALDAQLTRFDPRSELSRLNQSAGQGPQTVGRDLAAVLARSIEGTQLTRGAFDVTVGPLVALWIRAAHRDRAPSAEEITRELAHVGATRIRISGSAAVDLPDPGMRVDLGGVAKGYALDRVAAQLHATGFDTALVQLGESSTWALGAPPGEPGWRLGLRGASGDVEGVVLLRDRAFSVSSSLGQWSEIGGRRYGHVIDPRDGRALTRTAQAAVVSGDATLAEILSTALVVLGPDQGLEVVEGLDDVEARYLDESGEERTSSGWQQATRYRAFGPGGAEGD